ncbi:MAG: alkaline phosphatase family protein [Peptococcaceae bacterium]|nr:alkaline phosphatase family protein [Peptococcaceae bacterium]
MKQVDIKSRKFLLLGIDAMDPRLTRKYINKGSMPNLKKILERGAARYELDMIGGQPTVTPPMWTTLATGANPYVHGITGFFRASGNDLGAIEYNMDSRHCKAEPLWNVFVENNKRTLVFHWPGSAWPPTSESENLYVVDGTSPGSVGMAINQVNLEYLVKASEDINYTSFGEVESEASAPCVINDLDLDAENAKIDQEEKSMTIELDDFSTSMKLENVLVDYSQTSGAASDVPLPIAYSPIKKATGWKDAPQDAKEFTLLQSKGLIRRVGLILKNAQGIYDKVIIYNNKREMKEIACLTPGVRVQDIIDEDIKNNKRYITNKSMRILDLDPEGKELYMHVSASMDTTDDSVWHPKRIFKDVVENIGYIPPTSMVGTQDVKLIAECMQDCWKHNAQWQADTILYLIEQEKLDAVFSHFHAIDLNGHMFIKHLAKRDFNKNPVEVMEELYENIYKIVDDYIGKFMPLIDAGWNVFIFSDHGQVAPPHDVPLIGDIAGINAGLMSELGYTVLKQDNDGNNLREIDWSKTKAVAQRESYIYINLKGRNPYGIVDPSDKYELEEDIMSDLYSYRDPKTNHRVIALALRNREARLLGLGGPECGDIVYFVAEGYNFDHADGLSTTYGENDTSLSSVFIAAGPGIKENYITNRVIHMIDFAPTIATLAGLRMPKQCEGAPVYQILT